MSKTFSEEGRIDHTRRELAPAGRADQADQLGQGAGAQLALLQQTNENVNRLCAQLEQAGSLSSQLDELRRLSSQLEQAGYRLEGWKEPVAPAPASRPNGLVRLLGLTGVFLLGAVSGPALGERLSGIDWGAVRRWSEGVWIDRAYRLGSTGVVATPLVSGDAGTGGQQPAKPEFAPAFPADMPAFSSDEPAELPARPDAVAPAKAAGPARDEGSSAAEAVHVGRPSEAVPIEPAPPAPLPAAEHADPRNGQRPETEPEVAQPARTSQQSAEDAGTPVPPAPPEEPVPANPQAVEPPMPAVGSAPEVPAQQPPSNKTVESLNGQFKI